MSTDLAVSAQGVTFRYGKNVACDGIDLQVVEGAVHAVLGPNGSGKSTLFKVLATVYPLQGGTASILGLDLGREVPAIRRELGVVFQSPALDKHLTVRENLACGGAMYGLRGTELDRRIDEMLERTGLSDRANDRVKTLSGGLRRRTELAKGLLPKPRLLLLDEPSTGLDPGARQDLWRFVRSLDDITVLFTTHLMDEGEKADHVTIMRGGRVVGDGPPRSLIESLGGEVLEITCEDPYALAPRINERLGFDAVPVEDLLRIERERAHEIVPALIEAFGPEIRRLTLSHPSLEDVYIQMTGHHFHSEMEKAS